MFSRHVVSRPQPFGLAIIAGLALIVSPLVYQPSPSEASGSVVTEVVNVDFTTATTDGSAIVNGATGAITNLTPVGSPTGLGTADGLAFANTAKPTGQYLTGNLGSTTNMSQIVVEIVAKFPDTGCAAQNSGSMVFGLGTSSSSYVAYNIYRHSNFIGFNTFRSDLYGIAIPNTTDFFSYKFVMVPSSQGFSAQEIWVAPVGQALVQQSLDYRRTSSAVTPCSTITGDQETTSARVFAGGVGSYNNGNFALMTHPLGATTWGTTGSVRSVKITTTTTPPAPSVPGAPSISTITAGDSELSVAFTAPGSDGGASITNYDYSIDNGSSWTTASPSITTSPLVITGLTNGTEYQVKLRARNSAGPGTASSAVSGTPVQASPPPSSSPAPPPPPPPPPSAEVADLSIRSGNSGNSSVVRVRLTQPPRSGEQLTVIVKLLDSAGKVLQELKVNVDGSTAAIDVPVNRAIGRFTAVAMTSNQQAATEPVSLGPDTVRSSTTRIVEGTGEKRLAGRPISENLVFGPNSAELSKDVRQALRQAAVVAKARKQRVSVSGFSAVSGLGSRFERLIAERRALAVAEFLRKRGVDSWILFQGFSGLEGQEFSGPPRRVEIRILK